MNNTALTQGNAIKADIANITTSLAIINSDAVVTPQDKLTVLLAQYNALRDSVAEADVINDLNVAVADFYDAAIASLTASKTALESEFTNLSCQ